MTFLELCWALGGYIQYCNGDRAGVNPAATFIWRNALDAVHAYLVVEAMR